jgi:hypothetical protein
VADVGVQVLEPIPTVTWTAQTIPQHGADVWARFVAALPEDQQPATSSLTPVCR